MSPFIEHFFGKSQQFLNFDFFSVVKLYRSGEPPEDLMLIGTDHKYIGL